MFVLHVDLDVKSGSEKSLEAIFIAVFVPAISQQDGFSGTQLLRPLDSGAAYRLVIQFQNQELQQRWVTHPLHQEVWPQMEANFSEYSVHSFDNV